jgi:hypothetical protein
MRISACPPDTRLISPLAMLGPPRRLGAELIAPHRWVRAILRPSRVESAGPASSVRSGYCPHKVVMRMTGAVTGGIDEIDVQPDSHVRAFFRGPPTGTGCSRPTRARA